MREIILKLFLSFKCIYHAILVHIGMTLRSQSDHSIFPNEIILQGDVIRQSRILQFFREISGALAVVGDVHINRSQELHLLKI